MISWMKLWNLQQTKSLVLTFIGCEIDQSICKCEHEAK